MLTHLKSRRIAAHILNALCKSLNLGHKARHFRAENVDEWDNYTESCIIAIKNQRVVAQIELLEGTKAQITIPDWYGLIRNEHVSEFNPNEHGLICNYAKDPATDDPFPDSEGEVDFGWPQNLDLPPQQLVRNRSISNPVINL